MTKSKNQYVVSVGDEISIFIPFEDRYWCKDFERLADKYNGTFHVVSDVRTILTDDRNAGSIIELVDCVSGSGIPLSFCQSWIQKAKY